VSRGAGVSRCRGEPALRQRARRVG